jgi:hypothetical protein
LKEGWSTYSHLELLAIGFVVSTSILIFAVIIFLGVKFLKKVSNKDALEDRIDRI